MANDLKQVICMKWGELYGPEYVNRLYAMAKRQTTGELRFVCLTDSVDGLSPAIESHACPSVDIPMPHKLRGWRKLSLFAPSSQLFDLSGDWLYLDLDVVVTGTLDVFFDYQPDKSFIGMKNWSQPGAEICNTSVYRFRIGADQYLLHDLITSEKQNDIFRTFRNSQTYISRNIHEINFWPDEWCVLFKIHCVPPWPQRFWKQPVLPPGARVVAFPGAPNPHHAVRGQWPAKWHKKLYKHIRPASWIKQLWVE